MNEGSCLLCAMTDGRMVSVLGPATVAADTRVLSIECAAFAVLYSSIYGASPRHTQCDARVISIHTLANQSTLHLFGSEQ